jgi:hypothetical protein
LCSILRITEYDSIFVDHVIYPFWSGNRRYAGWLAINPAIAGKSGLFSSLAAELNSSVQIHTFSLLVTGFAHPLFSWNVSHPIETGGSHFEVLFLCSSRSLQTVIHPGRFPADHDSSGGSVFVLIFGVHDKSATYQLPGDCSLHCSTCINKVIMAHSSAYYQGT